MRKHLALLGRFVAACVFVMISAPPAAADTPSQEVRGSEVERRAQVLLKRAVAHIRAQGEFGATAFSRSHEFIDHDLYAYALKTDGTFLASGGSSVALAGQNVLAETDLQGKPFFSEIVNLAVTFGRGRVEYRWFNPADSRGEPKVAVFERVGNIIVAAGFYPPRATAADAKTLLRDAAAALESNQEAALRYFQRTDGPFIRDDLYVFVVRLSDGRFLAHGATPALVGTNGYDLIGPDGKQVVREMVEIVRMKKQGDHRYEWLNPVTNAVEKKHSFVRSVGDSMVGVGYYRR